MDKSIVVKEETRVRLFNMKINENYGSMDEVIRELLKRTRY